MNSKLIIALAAILALTSVNAQIPALESLSSKIESISASASGAGRTPLLQSAESAYSRISSEIAASSAVGGGRTSSAVSSAASESVSASSVASSASSVASSAAAHESSAGSAIGSATQAAQSNAPNAGTSLIGNGYSALLVQFAALSALFIASFVAMLA